MAREKREPMSADLLRQRRNLLVTSLALVAVNLAGASFKDEVSILGAGIEFDHPERILWAAWVLWAYFLVRYWQYLNEEPDLGIHKGMGRLICNRLPEDEFKEYSYWVTWRYWIFWTLYSRHRDSRDEHDSPSPIGPQNQWRKAIWTTRAFLPVATTTPRFTDYVVPFLVALLPALLAAWDIFAST